MSVSFLIDKITRSIEDKFTGRSLETSLLLVSDSDIKGTLKKDGWLFNWKKEFKEPNRQVYKLVTAGEKIIQGLISIEPIKNEQFIELHLIEVAPMNDGKKKKNLGEAASMVIFRSKLRVEMGFDGFVAFTAKTELVEHYMDTLGARIIYNNDRMAIFTPEAKKLVHSYYNNFFNDQETKIL